MVSGPEKKPVKIDELQKVVSENPDSAVAHMKLGTAWLQAGAAKKAVVALRRAVEIDPEYDEAWVNLGGILLGSWDFAGCVEVNRKVAKRNPGLLLAHYNQGLGHLYLREAKEMIACMRRVLEIDPDHAAGHYHLAVGLLEIGEVEEARAALDRAAELGHSPAPEFLKAIERKDKSAGQGSENKRSEGRS
jgi:Flp pilus assembly protein TadD